MPLFQRTHDLQRQFLLLVWLILLSGCSSAPSQIKYYELNSSTDLSYAPKPGQPKQILLMSLQVPDYMQQSKLVMRTAPYEMHYSSNHLWAQIPEKDFYTALITDLNLRASGLSFASTRGPLKYRDGGNNLFIEITHFYPTEKSEVILNGYWTFNTIASNGETAITQSSHFNVTFPLNEDGFAHAVAQQRRLISKLAEQILIQIDSQ